jgi:hypothetical protein
MSIELKSGHCPVCNHTLAASFFDGGNQPLATLGWPSSASHAKSMAVHPHDYVQCPTCTHVWNRSFSYDDIPYESNPNRMFNTGTIWKGHLSKIRDFLLTRLPASPTVLDVGCGEGHFLRGLSDTLQGKGRFLGFDPNTMPETGRGVEFHARYFDPLVDIRTFEPDLIIIRHVLEHFTDAGAFIDKLAWGAAQIQKPVLLFAETPCIDRVFETKRLADFFYEHPSQFNTNSFRYLMERAGEVYLISHGYDGEVVYSLVRLYVPDSRLKVAISSQKFSNLAERSRTKIRSQLDELAASGRSVAIWGGTGKAAAFIHQFGADAIRFPTVVDSDPDKVGTFVPGTGQIIQYRDILKSMLVEVIIIPTQWRAKDIIAEMAREGIVADQIFIENDGRLIDFDKTDHPYR